MAKSIPDKGALKPGAKAQVTFLFGGVLEFLFVLWGLFFCLLFSGLLLGFQEFPTSGCF